MGYRAFHLAHLFAVALVVALAALAVGCGDQSLTEDGGVAAFPPADADLDDGGSPPDAAPSRSSSKPSQYLGSPLCNASRWMGCYPDDPKTANSQECNLAPDGGPFSAGFDNAQLACHVQRANNDLGVAPVCTPAGSGTDGTSCSTSTDCAPAFECVGDGTCRRYCCAGQCSNQNQFCDVQTAVGSTLKVPVCIPVRRCGLLDTSNGGGSCSANETCAVVRDNGATSCVAVGPKQAGDSCDADHCARQLTCIGTSGDRSCYELCHTAAKGGECPSNQTCMGGLPLFPIPGVGICK